MESWVQCTVYFLINTEINAYLFKEKMPDCEPIWEALLECNLIWSLGKWWGQESEAGPRARQVPPPLLRILFSPELYWRGQSSSGARGGGGGARPPGMTMAQSPPGGQIKGGK